MTSSSFLRRRRTLGRVSPQHELDRVPTREDFSEEIGSNVAFSILCPEMCQQLEDLCNSVNCYFPNDQCTRGQKLVCVKDLFKVPNRPMTLNAPEVGGDQEDVTTRQPRQPEAPCRFPSLRWTFCPLLPHQEPRPGLGLERVTGAWDHLGGLCG